MYHYDLNIKLFGEISIREDVIMKIEPLSGFEHKFEKIKKLSSENILDTDILILNFEKDDVEKARKYIKKNAKIILIVDTNDFEKLEIGEEQFDYIWQMPLREDMISFFFKRVLKDIKCEKDLWLSENYLKSAIDSIPDLVWFKDIIGSHLKVNDAFCNAVGKSKSDIEGRGHYYIWDLKREDYEKGEYVCLETEEIVIKEKKTCLFDEKVKSKRGLRQFKTYKSPIFGEEGNVLGTVGIAHDVTDFENVGAELELILKTMPFSVLITASDGTIIYINSAFEKFFDVEKANAIGVCYKNWELSKFKNLNLDENKSRKEFTYEKNGEIYILEVLKEPIYDIFANSVGELYLYRDITIERTFEDQMRINSNTDFLTGLCNRRHFYELMSENKKISDTCLIYVDLDFFKDVNDVYGHQSGDDALILTAKILNESFPNDVITRIGGDEFLIAKTENYDQLVLEKEVNAFLNTIKKEFENNKKFANLSASVGISEPKKDISIDELLRRSDIALYKAKDNGRNCYKIYDEFDEVYV